MFKYKTLFIGLFMAGAFIQTVALTARESDVLMRPIDDFSFRSRPQSAQFNNQSLSYLADKSLKEVSSSLHKPMPLSKQAKFSSFLPTKLAHFNASTFFPDNHFTVCLSKTGMTATICRDLRGEISIIPTKCSDGIEPTQCVYYKAPTHCEESRGQGTQAPTRCADGETVPTNCPNEVLPTACQEGDSLAQTECSEVLANQATECAGDHIAATRCQMDDGSTQTVPTWCPGEPFSEPSPTHCRHENSGAGSNLFLQTRCPDGEVIPTQCPDTLEQVPTACFDESSDGALPTECPDGKVSTFCPDEIFPTLCPDGRVACSF